MRTFHALALTNDPRSLRGGDRTTPENTPTQQSFDSRCGRRIPACNVGPLRADSPFDGRLVTCDDCRTLISEDGSTAELAPLMAICDEEG
jgi:hypothetical protein